MLVERQDQLEDHQEPLALSSLPSSREVFRSRERAEGGGRNRADWRTVQDQEEGRKGIFGISCRGVLHYLFFPLLFYCWCVSFF